ncbi:MAG: type I secretion C-terminal target domain-containing protein [Burkholderiales bacterium]|nr:type I secretion C-terminal target domain-containing protein [Burkholderiales bacterium]
MGTGASQANIDPIAYNGVTPVNIPGVVVSDITQLPPILRDSVVAATPGNVITSGGTSVGFGGDGSGNIETLTIDGSIYTFNPTDTPTVGGSVTVSGTNRGVFNTVTNTLTVTTLINGSFVVDLDTGDYTYTAAPTITSVQQENIAYTVRDRDGDPAAASLTITVNPPPVGPAVPINVLTVSSPAAVAEGANLVYTVNLGLMTSNTATTFALALGGGTASNSDYNAIPTAFSNGVTHNSGTGLITVPASVVSFTVTVATLNDNVIDGATAETLPLIVGGVTGTGRITDTDTPTITGTGGNNTLTGDNNVNIIDGLGGNDTIDARNCNDLIRGGAGNDTMTGGGGADTFVFQLADKGAPGLPAADVLIDNLGTTTDRLDLSDLLQGEQHTVGIGNLLNYMSFEQVGANVLVHVSSAGSLDAGRTNVTAVQDQTIQLNTTTLLQLGGTGTTDSIIIQTLLTNGKLIVD